MPNNSAIPATIRVEDSLCPYCGDEKGTDQGGNAFCDNDDCDQMWGAMSHGKWAERSPAAAIQTLKALEPAAQVEVMKELAKGLDVAVVPREQYHNALLCAAETWTASDEGKRALAESGKACEGAIRQLAEDRKLDPADLLKVYTDSQGER